MQAGTILQKLLVQVCGSMHAVRRTALEAAVSAAVQSQTLTVTGLGRALVSPAREKHCIKRADRLLSNAHLQGERQALFRALARRLVGAQRHPIMLVDWSDLDACKRHQVLRASLVVAGRALTVYEEVHGRRTAVKRATHRRFLRRLKDLLPAGCQPLLVTDAGFCTPWFRAVEQLNWYWV
ncbi:MAG: transposase, partial [Burkholderiales bacterium]